MTRRKPTPAAASSAVVAYIDAAPELARTRLQTLRSLVREEAPDAVERMAYVLPSAAASPPGLLRSDSRGESSATTSLSADVPKKVHLASAWGSTGPSSGGSKGVPGRRHVPNSSRKSPWTVTPLPLPPHKTRRPRDGSRGRRRSHRGLRSARPHSIDFAYPRRILT